MCQKLKNLGDEERQIIKEIEELMRITIEAQDEVRSYIRSEIMRIKSETCMGLVKEVPLCVLGGKTN